ncbi:MAG: NADH-quinone oxidoreductase subunit NuoF [Elusimicrobiota bacterium]|nr:NADH-quinone oxidoreductase subunit NuoF [Elusimicrobiota bacterium]
MIILLENIKRKGYNGSLASYKKYGGYEALGKALGMESSLIISELKKSGLRGRGGAAFPTGIKWEFAADAADNPKYVVCNADEGEPGTFKDKLLMEKDPHSLIEGMAICGKAIGTKHGFIYIRGEYFDAFRSLQKALDETRKQNLIGKNIMGSDFSFDITLYRGAGAYVCGEETALLDSLEGKKGQSRVKPPFPTFEGLRNKPTVLNNVETLSNIAQIISKGGSWFSKIGNKTATGTKLFCLSGDIKKPGVYEADMNVTLNELINDYGGGAVGTLSAVFPGGLASSLLTPDKFDIKMNYESVMKAGSMLGSGAVIAINSTRCPVDLAANRMAEFFDHESCGKCTPCREGTKRAKEILQGIASGTGSVEDLSTIRDLADVLFDTSRCGLGQTALNAIRSSIDIFEDIYLEHITKRRCRAGICKFKK